MRVPNSAMPQCSAPWRLMTVPVTSGWRRAQARAARALVKKLMYPQLRYADGQLGSPAAPANTTAARGVHRAWPPSAWTVMMRPVPGQRCARIAAVGAGDPLQLVPGRRLPGHGERGQHSQVDLPGGCHRLRCGARDGRQIRGELLQLLPAAGGIGGAQPLIVFICGQPALGERLVEQAGGGLTVGVRRPHLRLANGGLGGAGLGRMSIHGSSHPRRRLIGGSRSV